jgi:general secretion pathway protein I
VKRRDRGFTLIEVLVAVAVLAIALGAVLSSVTRYAANAGYLKERTLAVFVAHNRLAEIELEPVYPAIGKSDGEVEMAGTKWHWDAEVLETPDPNLRRIDVRVQAPGREGDAVKLSSFVSRLGRQMP